MFTHSANPLGILSLRQRSLLRGSVLVLGSLGVAVWLGRPSVASYSTRLMLLPLLLALLGTVDTARCLQRRWSLYHASVVILLYADIMALTMILFLFLYPNFSWIL